MIWKGGGCLLACRSSTPVRFVLSLFFNVWTGDSTWFISYAKRLLDNTSLLMGVGLKSESGDVAGVEYLVEGPESGTWADSRSGYSHCG